jgi:predicted ArsR family transcriptional regulator
VETTIKQPDSPIRPVDQLVLDLLRRYEGLSVTDLMERLEVTATAVRQRLDRLEESGFIEKRKQAAGRGRPSFNYYLTEHGAQQAGVTYSDLAIAMWDEIQSIDDFALRNQLTQKVSARLGGKLKELLPNAPLDQRMQVMAGLMSHRRVPTMLTGDIGLPVLEMHVCPYPDLVGGNHDRSVCDLEIQVMSAALGHEMELSKCRLDGHGCCQFRPTQEPAGLALNGLVETDSQSVAMS